MYGILRHYTTLFFLVEHS